MPGDGCSEGVEPAQIPCCRASEVFDRQRVEPGPRDSQASRVDVHSEQTRGKILGPTTCCGQAGGDPSSHGQKERTAATGWITHALRSVEAGAGGLEVADELVCHGGRRVEDAERGPEL